MLFLFLVGTLAIGQDLDPLYALKLQHPEEEIENADVIRRDIDRGYNPTRRLEMLLLGAIGIAALVHRDSRTPKITDWLGIVILIHLAWTLLSVAAADDYLLALRRITVFGLFCLAVTGLAARVSLREITWFALLGGCLVLGTGIVCELALGTFRPFTADYRFAGVTHPIGQAMSCGALAMAATSLAYSDRRVRPIMLLLAVLALVMAMATRSRGPLVALAGGMTVFFLMVESRHRTWILLGIGAILLMAAALVAVDPDLGTSLRRGILLGRENETTASLTGRVPVWLECLRYAAERPLLGYGYESFWTPERFARIASATDFSVADSHNGYLELLLGTGVPGVLLVLTILVLSVRKAIRWQAMTGVVDYAFMAGMLVMLATNMTLMSLYSRPTLVTLVPFVLIVMLAYMPLPVEGVRLWGRPGTRGPVAAGEPAASPFGQGEES